MSGEDLSSLLKKTANDIKKKARLPEQSGGVVLRKKWV